MILPPGIFEQKHLASMTWFRSGGEARYYAAPGNEAELLEITEWARAQQIPIQVLGLGANSLFPDEGFPGVVIHMKKFKQSSETFTVCSPTVVEVAAGIALQNLVDQLNKAGFGGLECFVGIPGTVGGSVWGNAGAQGLGLGERVEAVRVLDPTGELAWISGNEILWDYRSSGLGEHIVLAVRFQVEPNQDPSRLQKMSSEYLEYKHAVQPFDKKSTGCIFKNPESEKSAGKLIDECGLKGMREGGAQVSELHGNFIVNLDGSAKTADVLALTRRIQEKVYAKTRIRLEQEVVIIGEVRN